MSAICSPSSAQPSLNNGCKTAASCSLVSSKTPVKPWHANHSVDRESQAGNTVKTKVFRALVTYRSLLSRPIGIRPSVAVIFEGNASQCQNYRYSLSYENVLVGCVAQWAERRSLAGELTLSCRARPAAEG